MCYDRHSEVDFAAILRITPAQMSQAIVFFFISFFLLDTRTFRSELGDFRRRKKVGWNRTSTRYAVPRNSLQEAGPDLRGTSPMFLILFVRDT